MEHGQNEDLNDLMRRRREEYNELLAHGVQPFAYEYPVDAEAAEVLASFTDDGVRAVFEHLAIHGVITEAEVTRMLGGGRHLDSDPGIFNGFAELRQALQDTFLVTMAMTAAALLLAVVTWRRSA